jgi:hypothetical protein
LPRIVDDADQLPQPQPRGLRLGLGGRQLELRRLRQRLLARQREVGEVPGVVEPFRNLRRSRRRFVHRPPQLEQLLSGDGVGVTLAHLGRERQHRVGGPQLGRLQRGLGQPLAERDLEHVEEVGDDGKVDLRAPAALGEAQLRIEDGIAQQTRPDEFRLRHADVFVRRLKRWIVQQRHLHRHFGAQRMAQHQLDGMTDLRVGRRTAIPVDTMAAAVGDRLANVGESVTRW